MPRGGWRSLGRSALVAAGCCALAACDDSGEPGTAQGAAPDAAPPADLGVVTDAALACVDDFDCPDPMFTGAAPGAMCLAGDRCEAGRCAHHDPVDCSVGENLNCFAQACDSVSRVCVPVSPRMARPARTTSPVRAATTATAGSGSLATGCDASAAGCDAPAASPPRAARCFDRNTQQESVPAGMPSFLDAAAGPSWIASSTAPRRPSAL